MNDTLNKNTATSVPENVIYDSKVLDNIIREATSDIPGILGPSFALTDPLKHVEDVDMTRGMHMSVDGDEVSLRMKVIAELGQSIPDAIETMTQRVTDALQSQTGLKVAEVKVEVVDSMTREAYESRFRTPKEEKKD